MVTLHSGELRVKKVLKPTKAEFFSEIHEGDSIGIIHKLERTSGSRNGLYATEFKVMNYTRNNWTFISGNNLVARLKNFELETL